MNTVHDKLLRRFVWIIGLGFLIIGFVTPLTGIPPFLITIILILGLGAVYSLERHFIGIMGHLGFFAALFGTIFVFNSQKYLVYVGLNDNRSIILFWIFLAIFVVGFVIFGIATIRTNFVSTEIGYLLLITPAIVFLPLAIKRFAFAGFFLATGYFLMLCVSRTGEYDKKIGAQHNLHRTGGILPAKKK